ncbi:MAG TPA: phytanoyl-CoA dioxygenase family protein [Bacillales bacterium]|nr:phytanoyl-CoA dioxygenase family protein [Bacillales bacterium]
MFSDKDVAFYKDNGYLLVKGVFSAEEVAQMREAVGKTIEKASLASVEQNHTWEGDYLPEEERKKLVLKGFHNLEYHDSSFLRAISHPNMVAVLSKLIGPNVQLHHSKMLVKPPEKGAAFPMHQDYPYFPHENHSMLAASVHLDDADDQNGCLHVVPESHKNGQLSHLGHYRLDHQEYPIEMGTPCPAEAGDVLFFNYLTIHGSKPNRSERTRRNILFQYRDPADPPKEKVHVDWGQGLMVCGESASFKDYDPKSMIEQKV